MNLISAEEILIDTDVVSFLYNRDPMRLPRYEKYLEGRKVYVSFATIGELRFGVLLRNWSLKRQELLRRHLSRYRVVHSNEDIVEAWAKIRIQCRREGTPIAPQDAWIAATAQHLGVPLLTHNAAHFNVVKSIHVVSEPDPG